MRWQDKGRSSNLEDRRGSGGGGGFRSPRGLGGLGLGGIVVVLLISWATGTNPMQLLGALGGAQGSGVVDDAPAPVDDAREEPMVRFLSAALDDAQGTWRDLLSRQGQQYRDAKLVLFRQQVNSACGDASAAMGPFYCPGDEKVYLDLGFFDELDGRFGAPGDFAQVYVLAHEIGHHIQHLTGTESAMRRAQRGDPSQENALSVALELQADCYAGIWARAVSQRGDLEAGDLDEGLGAAAAVGDDRLQQQATGEIHPEKFTHGTSAQRSRWFRVGFDGGEPARCDTFNGQP